MSSVRRVLDVQRRQAVAHGVNPNRILTTDVLVLGGGLGGVAAAEALARQSIPAILTEPTSMIGGQLTSQAVHCPDENRYIETNPAMGTRSYHEVRSLLREHYAQTPGIRPGRERNVGGCWVSRISGEPRVWEQVIRRRLQPLEGAAGVRGILTRHQIFSVHHGPDGQFRWADFVDLDTGRITRIAARYLLDASEFGDGLALAGMPYRLGQEGRGEFNEPSAPEEPRPDWVQSFTYCFVVRWQPEGPHNLVERPAEYDYFKSLGEYTLNYDYPEPRGVVTYKVFTRAPNSGGPFWTYRRMIDSAAFSGNPHYSQDLSMINWRGNDFHEENPVDQPLDEQVRILRRGKDFAQGFLYWLQNECPRDDGSGFGYPEMQLEPGACASDDGFALHPYIRESRRLVSDFTLTENHVRALPDQPGLKWQEEFADTVGLGLYSIDIHPAKGEKMTLSPALPYHIPLGAYIGAAGPTNVLPAAKNFGATRLALASARMHPIEWQVGEVAGELAAFALRSQKSPREIRENQALLQAFQARLGEAGIPIRWSEIITP